MLGSMPEWISVGLGLEHHEAQLLWTNMIFQVCWMSIMYVIALKIKNASMVDFGWPSGYLLMSIAFLFTYKGDITRRTIICGLYIITALRFNIGWLFGRGDWKVEDQRWKLWRERWQAGEGWFGIRSVEINLFFFYHAQSLTNVFIMSVPLHIACSDTTVGLRSLEYGALAFWLISFTFENIADFQLHLFKTRKQKGGSHGTVMNEGLWKYSRHPNYFFEFLVWMSYSLFSISSVKYAWEIIDLALGMFVAYYFLVCFTGAYIGEKSSLKSRGDVYRRYQQTTSQFVPWFPLVPPKVE